MNRTRGAGHTPWKERPAEFANKPLQERQNVTIFVDDDDNEDVAGGQSAESTSEDAAPEDSSAAAATPPRVNIVVTPAGESEQQAAQQAEQAEQGETDPAADDEGESSTPLAANANANAGDEDEVDDAPFVDTREHGMHVPSPRGVRKDVAPIIHSAAAAAPDAQVPHTVCFARSQCAD